MGDSYVQKGSHLILENVVFEEVRDTIVPLMDHGGGGVTMGNSFGCIGAYVRGAWGELTDVMWVTCPDMVHKKDCSVLKKFEGLKVNEPIGHFSNIMPWEVLNFGQWDRMWGQHPIQHDKAHGGFLCPICLEKGSTLHFEWKLHVWNFIKKREREQRKRILKTSHVF